MGDTISMTGEVTMIHCDGHVTVRLHGYDMPITSRTKQPKDQSRIESGDGTTQSAL